MDNLLLQPATKKQLGYFIAQPPQAIALIGAAHSGKGFLASQLAAHILRIPNEKLNSYPYFRTYTPENNSISIETVREITKFVKLKTTGTNTIHRIIIIEDAHTMTVEAQNALLKTLEEPPSDTVIILTVTELTDILPTIASRLQTVTVYPIDIDQAKNYFNSQGFEEPNITQCYFMSGGRIGLMHALLSDSQDHPFAQSIQLAKEVLRRDSFERLLLIDNIIKNKQTHGLIEAICVIARSALYAEINHENSKKSVVKRWGIVLEKAEATKQLLIQNAQGKLVLTSLFLEI